MLAFIYFQIWLPKYSNAGTPLTSKSTSGPFVNSRDLQETCVISLLSLWIALFSHEISISTKTGMTLYLTACHVAPICCISKIENPEKLIRGAKEGSLQVWALLQELEGALLALSPPVQIFLGSGFWNHLQHDPGSQISFFWTFCRAKDV